MRKANLMLSCSLLCSFSAVIPLSANLAHAIASKENSSANPSAQAIAFCNSSFSSTRTAFRAYFSGPSADKRSTVLDAASPVLACAKKNLISEKDLKAFSTDLYKMLVTPGASIIVGTRQVSTATSSVSASDFAAVQAGEVSK